INQCWILGEQNPIQSIHDVGAGGLSNALPELVHACNQGAEIELRAIPNAAPGMSPLEIWCNEAQERFVLAIAAESVTLFNAIAERERCLFAIVGTVIAEPNLIVNDSHFANQPINLPLNVLFEDMPRMHCVDQTRQLKTEPVKTATMNLADA